MRSIVGLTPSGWQWRDRLRTVACCALVVVLSSEAARAETPVPVSECGVLAGDGIDWYLTGDLVASPNSGNCLQIEGQGSTLDLMGYTILYDAEPTGIPNGGFEITEAGDPDLPEGWDLSVANGHVRLVSTAYLPMVGTRFLEFVDPAPGDEIRSPWADLPPSRACTVSFIAGFTYGAFTTMPAIRLLVERESGGVVYDEVHDGEDSQTSLLFQRYSFVTPDVPGERYRVRIIVERPASGAISHHRFAFDEVQLRTDDTWGIRIAPGSSDIMIRNGVIEQGAGSGTESHAIRVEGGCHLSDLRVVSHGTASTAVYAGTGLSSVEIDHCWLESTAESTFRWMDLLNVVTLSLTSPGAIGTWIHDNTIVASSGFGGIRVSGDYDAAAPGYRIEDNLIRSRCALTDHHAIVVYRSQNAVVARNVIESTGGQGLLLSSGFAGATVEDNQITLDGIKPNVEFGLVSFDAIRMNDYRDPANRSDHLRVQRNTLRVTGGLDPWFEPGYGSDCGELPVPDGCGGKVLNGIMFSANGVDILFEDNTIQVELSDPKVIGSCLEIGRAEPAGGMPIWRNNLFESNQKLLVIGGYADHAARALFSSCTLRYLEPTVGTRHTMFSRRTRAGVHEVEFLDPNFEAGTSFAEGECYMRTFEPYDFDVSWTLGVRVIDSAQRPLSGRSVRVLDVDGETVAFEVTDGDGWVRSMPIVHQRITGPAWIDRMDVDVRTPHRVLVEGASPAVVVVDTTCTVEVVLASGGRSHPIRPRVEWNVEGSGFRLSLPRAGRARLDVFNVRGERVQTVFDGWRDVGEHVVAWPTAPGAGARFSRGIYFARLRVGRDQTVRKFALR